MSSANYPPQIIQRVLLNEFGVAVPVPTVASGALSVVNILRTVADAPKVLTLTSGTWLLNGNGQCAFTAGVTSCEVMCVTINRVDVAGRQSSSTICVCPALTGGIQSDFTANTLVPFSVSDCIVVPEGQTQTYSLNITYTGLVGGGGASINSQFLVADRIGNYPVSSSVQV
jgi:hypothetical protein